MKSRLEDLHVELVEIVMTSLELCDIASIRLASRTMGSKVLQRSFITLFERKNVKLSSESLQKMVHVTRKGWLGSLLQHCTVTGIVKKAGSVPDEDNTELLSLLVKAFSNLRQRSVGGSLVSLQLRIAGPIESANSETTEVPVTHSGQNVWDAALHTFKTTMSALCQSRLSVNEHLDAFRSIRGCSLVCNTFIASFRKSASVQNFRHLKTLRVSLSAPRQPAIEHQKESTAIGWDLRALKRYSSLTLRSVTHLSDIMPDLETLDFHWYKVGDKTFTYPRQTNAAEESNNSSVFTKLRSCSMHGLSICGSDLLDTLQALRPVTVTMTNIRLTSGTLAPIIEYLTNPDSPVTSYHLHNILEGILLVHFDIPGASKFNDLSGNVGPTTLTRKAEHVKDAVGYSFATGWPLRSEERRQWLKNKVEEFGPPRVHRYDFVKLNAQSAAESDETDDR